MPRARQPAVLSRHVTSEGIVTYTRDPAGRVQVWLQPWAERGQPLDAAPGPRPDGDEEPAWEACA